MVYLVLQRNWLSSVHQLVENVLRHRTVSASAGRGKIGVSQHVATKACESQSLLFQKLSFNPTCNVLGLFRCDEIIPKPGELKSVFGNPRIVRLKTLKA